MRFWSKGLGERELVIDLSKGNLTNEEGKVFMRGIITEPVHWHYEVTLFPEVYRRVGERIFRKPILRVEGTVQRDISGLTVVADRVEVVE